ncbi:RNA 2',3'-cyclic phosphodiesterase [Modestobacter sp. I12A-02628]|uniref:RNA 2',3'-cyclic phosphodiesterase n=1 Tax=Goekera deserti TaxID=2497753 RepID=A0A7K3WIU8_9ACTN|nr:RNA 2',3'-cyclic phosphodiesterase [Goekera deserti]MPQ99314.1 RNA 2',3'-cyclic phosphodiesterase [Goekera deserti]NDI50313.1 RNA 2',3'-cyclic phosphodiesterase [Goekera deserti]NEL56435.1 RNA 2',3'-cyclic phosphodiesterase [Goekera deserti]
MTPPPAAVDHLAAALASLRDVPGAPRWTPPARWHLTLVFLGDVPSDVTARLADRAGHVVRRCPPLSVRLAGGGSFGVRRRPGVCWVGVAGDVEALADLAGRLAGSARDAGVDVERREFRAHLTVGRWRPGAPVDAGLPARLDGYRGPVWPVTRVQLLRSHLGPDARHEPLAGWPVGVPADGHPDAHQA